VYLAFNTLWGISHKLVAVGAYVLSAPVACGMDALPVILSY
jgi:hypothetical protein